MKRIAILVLSIAAVVLSANPLWAQNQQGDENSMLPEIDPQDIEIRSQFKARFPGLRRQPILGFDPTPRVYQIDPNRTPFMETPEQVVANLPVSELSRPAPPAYQPFPYADDINAFSRVGIGSYVTPEVKFWGVTRLNSKSYVGGDLDFSSSDGHLDNQQSSFRFMDANGEFATKVSDDIRVGLNGGFRSSFNNMFDLSSALIPDGARKEYDGFNLGAEFRQFQNSISGWKAQANIRYFNAALKNAGTRSGKNEERVYNASLAKRWAGAHVNETFTVKAGIRGGNYDNSALSDSWYTGQGGVEYERLFNYSTKVKADASVYYGSDNFDSKVYFGPTLSVEQPLLDILTLTVKAGAEPYVKSMESLSTANRFLHTDTALRHSYKIFGSAEASLEYAKLGRLDFGIQYQNIDNRPVFARRQISGGLTTNYGFYEPLYLDTYTVKAYAGVTHQIVPEKFMIHAKAYAQSPEIKNGGRIPYEEKVGLNAGLNLRMFDRLSIEAWTDYVGARRTYLTDEKLGGFLLLGGQLDVQITDRFGAYVKLVNLLNQDYEIWQGYTERPFQAFGGITVTL